MSLLKRLGPNRYTVFLLLLLGVFAVGVDTRLLSNGFIFDQHGMYIYLFKAPIQEISIINFIINILLLSLLFWYFFSFFTKTELFRRNKEKFNYALKYSCAFIIFHAIAGFSFIAFYTLYPTGYAKEMLYKILVLVFTPFGIYMGGYVFLSSRLFNLLSWLGIPYKVEDYTSLHPLLRILSEVIARIPYFLLCFVFLLLGMWIYRLKKKSK